jgi:AraC-like DNA-binding protein
VGGLLLLHAVTLALPGPRPAARAALLLFVVGVFSYLFTQQADVLLHLPQPLAYALLAFSVAGAAWLWVAARALFDDGFGWTPRLMAAVAAVVALGLAANLPYFPDGDGPWRIWPEGSLVVGLGRLHAATLLAFSVAALWEVARGWRDDLVQARRVARRWVALGIGAYAGLVLVVELALRGQAVGRLLPALHVAAIGLIALALAVLVARRSLAAVLGSDPLPLPQPAPPAAATPDMLAAAPALPDKAARLLARLDQAMAQDRVYRREGLTLADLAQALSVGEAPLRELINQRLGFRNFNDFLHQHRLQEAAERLSREDLPILSIALECGYGSIGPFNRAFKQRLGVTPTEYRAGARLKQASA